jgi:hypothetical protein
MWRKGVRDKLSEHTEKFSPLRSPNSSNFPHLGSSCCRSWLQRKAGEKRTTSAGALSSPTLIPGKMSLFFAVYAVDVGKLSTKNIVNGGIP